MNINPEIMYLETLTGLPVSPDVYTGNNDSFIVFAYEYERPVDHADDAPIADSVDVQVNLYTPTNMNYLTLKDQIKTYLETLGEVTNIRSWIDPTNVGGKSDLESTIRHTAFSVTITKGRS